MKVKTLAQLARYSEYFISCRNSLSWFLVTIGSCIHESAPPSWYYYCVCMCVLMIQLVAVQCRQVTRVSLPYQPCQGNADAPVARQISFDGHIILRGVLVVLLARTWLWEMQTHPARIIKPRDCQSSLLDMHQSCQSINDYLVVLHSPYLPSCYLLSCIYLICPKVH